MTERLGFDTLELGDNVIDSFDRKGVVVQVWRELVVLRHDKTWDYADNYVALAKEHDNPYRTDRKPWDFDGEFVDVEQLASLAGYPPHPGPISKAIYAPGFEGTDAEPRVGMTTTINREFADKEKMT